jgi:hypothetical protein
LARGSGFAKVEHHLSGDEEEDWRAGVGWYFFFYYLVLGFGFFFIPYQVTTGIGGCCR